MSTPDDVTRRRTSEIGRKVPKSQNSNLFIPNYARIDFPVPRRVAGVPYCPECGVDAGWYWPGCGAEHGSNARAIGAKMEGAPALRQQPGAWTDTSMEGPDDGER